MAAHAETVGTLSRALSEACASDDLVAATAAMTALKAAVGVVVSRPELCLNELEQGINNALAACARHGRVRLAEWLCGGTVNVHTLIYYRLALQNACGAGQLAFAKWMHDVRGMDVHSDGDCAFLMACANGHLAVARWLHDDVGGVDVHEGGDAAFEAACSNGRLDVVKWLHDVVGGFDVHANNECAFQRACRGGQLEVAKWLYNVVGGINVHAGGGGVGVSVCVRAWPLGRREMAAQRCGRCKCACRARRQLYKRVSLPAL